MLALIHKGSARCKSARESLMHLRAGASGAHGECALPGEPSRVPNGEVPAELSHEVVDKAMVSVVERYVRVV